MNTEFFTALEILERDKGIPMSYMLEKIEAALLNAYKKEYEENSNVRILLDPEKKEVKMYQQKEIVEVVENPITQISLEDAQKIKSRAKLGTVLEIKMDTKNFRRLSAVKAKQVIIQGIREAERSRIKQEYENKRGEAITAVVQRVDDSTGNVIVDTGTSIATLIRAEQIPGETFRVDQHIKVYVTEVKEETKGPIVTLSRTNPGLVKRLFELSVPELEEGSVVIHGVAREAGSRTKMAVYSRDEQIDPIGACIGNRGIRINSIKEELHGENIDLIKFSEKIEDFIAAALAPAKIRSVVMETERSCKVYVDADQLSLAIGKEGQNVRLAARLTGCKIDIKVEESL